MEEARLFARVGIDFERAVVLPRNLQAGWHSHDARCTVGAAGFARALVGIRIPGDPDPTSLVVEWNTREVAAWWRHHAPPPFVGHDRDPGAGEVDWRHSLCRRRRWLRREVWAVHDAHYGKQCQHGESSEEEVPEVCVLPHGSVFWPHYWSGSPEMACSINSLSRI